MAKLSQVNRGKKRAKLAARYAAKRTALKAKAENMSLPAEERFTARMKLAKLPRNSSPTRIHHRCEMSGRSKGYYRKLKLSRIALRDLANFGQIPGMTKASW
jgi:small subunit ribosomal protein S14